MMVRLLLIFLIITTSLHAQNDSTYTFNDHVNSVYGDLNKDGLIDLAVVYQDTTHEGTIGDDTYKVTLDEVIKINPLPNLNTFEPNAEGLY